MKTVRDPIHLNIELDDLALELVDTPEFQRLRRIKQLGYANLLYPGANHTRFEHSLGTYYLALCAGSSLKREGWLDADSYDKLRAAALLHDLGHGPFSHISEELIQEIKNISHEELSCRIIRETNIKDILAGYGLESSDIAELILGKGRFGSLIAGDLDVDRMDYLLRDAHYTGIRITTDTARIISKLTPDDSNKIAISYNALPAAEGLLLARFLMYPILYMHHVCRVSGQMLKRAIVSALEENFITMDEIERFDDPSIISRLTESTGYSKEICSALDGRRLFKRAYSGLVKQKSTFYDELVDPEKRCKLESEIADASGIDQKYLILDVPPPPMLEEARAKIVLKNVTKPIERVSSLVKSLKRAQLDHWKFWVFTTPTNRNRAGIISRKILGEEDEIR
jgi:hypothetical protein